ncbi:MAG: energy-coupling factor transporter transmembrane component T family protein [Plesiomonas sp.]
MKLLQLSLRNYRSIDDFSRRDNFITNLDPRAKILSSLAVLLAIVSQNSYAVTSLLPLLIFPVVVMALADIPFKFLLGKLLFMLPFSLMLGLMNPILDHNQWLTPWGSMVSAGWLSLISIVLRVLLCVSISILLFSTSGIKPIVTALQRLKVPRVLTTQIYLLYQFFFVVAEEFISMLQAYSMRRIKRKKAVQFKFYTQLLKILFIRAMDRCVRIHQSMLARGFSGQLHNHTKLTWQITDTVWTLFWFSFAIICWKYNLVTLFGSMFIG